MDGVSGRASPGGLSLAVFVAGAASMLLEVAALRALAPAFGASLYTWTNVIGVVLAALAAGSWLGGRLGDRWPSGGNLGCVLLASAALVLPAPLLAVPLGTWLLPEPAALSPLTATPHVVRGSLALTVVLFAPAMLCAGMIGPCAVRALMAGGLPSGRAAGRALAWSTAGGLAGTWLPGLVLFGWLGVRGSILGASAALALAAIVVARGRGEVVAGCLVIGLAAGLGIATRGLPVRGPVGEGGDGTHEVALVQEIESPYQYVRISRWAIDRSAGGPRVSQLRLSLDEGVSEYHSLLEEGRILTGGYYDFFSVLPALVAGSESEAVQVAILGGGAGTMPRMLRALYGERVGDVMSVELDPAVAGQGARFGWQAGPKDHAVVGDGRTVLRSVDHRFDVVILDAYTRQVAIPAHLATTEFFGLVRARLTARGLFAINVSAPDLESPLCRALVRTLRETYASVGAVSVPGTWNIVLLAAPEAGRVFVPAAVPAGIEAVRGLWLQGLLPGEVVPGEGLLLADDHAPLEQLARRR